MCIAVGFDGSPDSEAALRWACALAVSARARIRVVHAVGMLEHAGLAHHAGREASARAVASEEGLDPSAVQWLVEDGEPCAALRRNAEGPDAAELIVVGTRGAGAHPGPVLGSTSLALASYSPVPLVIVPSPDRKCGSGASNVAATRPHLSGGAR